jgi:hypothetical protein
MAEPADNEFRTSRRIGIGCVTVIGGFFSGGMIGVFVGKVVGSIRGCNPGPELPACDWQVYAGIGMLIGVVTLPLLVVNRMMHGRAADDKKE